MSGDPEGLSRNYKDLHHASDRRSVGTPGEFRGSTSSADSPLPTIGDGQSHAISGPETGNSAGRRDRCNHPPSRDDCRQSSNSPLAVSPTRSASNSNRLSGGARSGRFWEHENSDRRPRSPVRTPPHLREWLDGDSEECPGMPRGRAPSWGSTLRPRGLAGTLRPPP